MAAGGVAPADIALPKHVLVYGGDHSPWVNAVLLGLHLRKVPHTVVTAPPPGALTRHGILMPAISRDGGPWQWESLEILHDLGFHGGTADEIRDLQHAMRGGINRADDLRKFWYEWSLVAERHPSRVVRLASAFHRALPVFHFAQTLRGMRSNPKTALTPFHFRPGASGYAAWERRLALGGGPFLGGAAPSAVDLELFGGVQCHCSMPWVPAVAQLRDDPALPRIRAWIAAMHRLCEGYTHCYSGAHFAAFAPVVPSPPAAPALERASFWAGTVTVHAAYPLTASLSRYWARINVGSSTVRVGRPHIRTAVAPPPAKL